MPSPLTFFKTLANQKGKPPPSQGYQIKGKLRKPSIRYPSSQTHTNVQPETNNNDREQMIEDDLENGIPYHPSIPEGNAETWRKFPPAYRVETAMTNNSHPLSQPRQSSVPSENPIVSRYYSAAHAVQPQPREPMPPSRTWSTIPSVRRESMAPRRGYEEDAIADETDDLDTIPQAQSTLRQTTPSRRSTVRTIGQLPSIHERHLVEYPKTKYPKTVNVKQKQVEPPEVGPERNVRSALKSQRQPIPEVAKVKPANHDRNTGFDDGGDTSEPEVYHYIVPSGVEVIFEDEAGTEITRVGTTITAPDQSRPLQSAPIVVQNEFGRVLYQDVWSPDRGGRRTNHNSRHESGQFMPESVHPKIIQGNRHADGVMSSPSSSLSSNSTKLIMIDKGGHQIPITTANLLRESLKEQRQHPVSGTSHHASISNT